MTNMKILKNEVVREMTNEEEQLYLSRTFEDFFVENPEPTSEERIAALEEELKAAKILLGLED